MIFKKENIRKLTEILIYHIHIVAAVFAFVKNWQKSGTKDGILSVLMIGLFFAIGWALTGTLAWIIWPQSLNSPWFTADTLSLVLVMIPESIFYYHFFIKDRSASPAGS